MCSRAGETFGISSTIHRKREKEAFRVVWDVRAGGEGLKGRLQVTAPLKKERKITRQKISMKRKTMCLRRPNTPAASVLGCVEGEGPVSQ